MAEDARNTTRTDGESSGDGGSSGGYVHDPSAFDGNEATGSAGGGDDGDGPRTTRAYHPEVPQSEAFGAKGWVLVAAIVVAFVVVPIALLLVPYSDPFLRSLGLTWRDAYLTLPLVPAMVLAALAVWVAVTD